MLTGVPKSWFSYSYAVEDSAGGHVAEVEMASVRERGALRIHGMEIEVSKESGREFVLRSAPDIRAVRPSAFRNTIEIRDGSRTFTLSRSSWLRRDCLLHEGDRLLGTLTCKAFSRRVNIDLPEELPLPLRMFVFWLALLGWRRDDASSG